MSVDVMIIANNEAMNLPRCLEALDGWVRRIFVIDSGSTDGTPEIAESRGATVVRRGWPGYAKQKNWGLDNLPFESDWILILDADEVITPEVRTRIEGVVSRKVDEVAENGFFINRVTLFQGRQIRHCGYFPSWNMRLFKRGRARYEDRPVHEHMLIDPPVGYIREPMLHDDRRGLEHYMTKHNWYSTLEAEALYREIWGGGSGGSGSGGEAHLPRDSRRRRWLKRHVIPRVPSPGLLRFCYMYFFKLGFLDGRAGFDFCRFIGMYDNLVGMKLRELRRVGGETEGRQARGADREGGQVQHVAASGNSDE